MRYSFVCKNYNAIESYKALVFSYTQDPKPYTLETSSACNITWQLYT